MLKKLNNENKISLLALSVSIIAFLISIGDHLYTRWSYQQSLKSYTLAKEQFEEAKDQYTKAQKTSQLKNLQSLSQTFRDNKIFTEIRQKIEQCKPIYEGLGGTFTSDEVGQYLNFFEEIGLGYKSGTFKIEDIDFIFGSYIVELVNHPFFEIYVKEYRKNNFQPKALSSILTIVDDIERINLDRKNQGVAVIVGCKRRN